MSDKARNTLNEKKDRLAAALRENLRKRKEQQRARADKPLAQDAKSSLEETGAKG